jgi:uncharacterized protein (DUF427 family)
MTDRPIRIPGPDHPITIMPEPSRVVVTVAGRVVADSKRALSLKEAVYPPVLYIPREDAHMELLERSELTTYCPYKGECNYFSIPLGGARSRDAVWSYEHPYDSVAAIRNHLAFYPDRVDSIERSPA